MASQLVFDYWASLSRLMPKNGYTLDQHQSDYFESLGIDWNQSYFDQVNQFYATYSGLGDTGSLVAEMEAYFASLTGTMPQAWIDEIKAYALSTLPSYPGITSGVYEFMRFVLQNQNFDTDRIYIQTTQPDDYFPYVWFDTTNSEDIAVMKLSDGGT